MQLAGSRVAESHGSVVGLTGLFDRGTSAEVEPVVVTGAVRDQGIGRRLVGCVVEEALARGYEYLAVRPVDRNVAAVRRFRSSRPRVRPLRDAWPSLVTWAQGQTVRHVRRTRGPGPRSTSALPRDEQPEPNRPRAGESHASLCHAHGLSIRA
ncbi:MAG: GNAT family N-acetyltransferase [Candidatus Dormibacteraeota bacterium]|nr:GNAT family N-acetyltransferase [Candidatus Dormibacteraeota bacterium]